MTCYRWSWICPACRTSKMTWTSAAGWQRKNQLLFCQVLYCSLLNIYIHDSFETIVLEELIQIGSFICLVQDIFLIHLEIDHLLCLRCNVTWWKQIFVRTCCGMQGLAPDHLCNWSVLSRRRPWQAQVLLPATQQASTVMWWTASRFVAARDRLLWASTDVWYCDCNIFTRRWYIWCSSYVHCTLVVSTKQWGLLCLLVYKDSTSWKQ